MKILIITLHYFPEPNFITKDLAEHYARQGNNVVVITAHPNYPFGKFYDSVRSIWPSKSIENGVVVWRLPLYTNHSLSKMKRILSYLSFCFISALFAPFVMKKPALVFVYQTPFTTAIAALWFKFIKKTKLYYICADLWPESFSASGVAPNHSIMKILYTYSRWINRQAEALICSTRGTQKRYILDGIPLSKTFFVPVWVDGVNLQQNINFEKKFNSRKIVYAGNIGAAQGLQILVQAALLAQNRKIPVQFDIYGTGAEENEILNQIKHHKLENIYYHGRVSPEEAFQAIAESMIIFIHLIPSELFKMTIPSKLSGAFAAGGLILAGLEGEAEQIIRHSGAGFVFKPNNCEGFLNHVQKILNMSLDEYRAMCERGIHFYAKNFDKSSLLGRYDNILEITN